MTLQATYSGEELNVTFVASTNPIYIGTEDGVAIYVSRENIDSIDRAMQRDHMRRTAHDNAAKALYEYYQRQKSA